ncbi:FosX/FosE/FosI family fosfomycin resistance hydrolase [Roseibium suaedae]|uniref:Catechol 2,3-dioxygenase n=1 Tax=Roseibium suaedae TaxID=735517 RepID=A0A1M7I892_9HYPH|nr:FosX/FosE/FosI family fosfomycin resistance hydrolase [Roseibium suaedae]SHM36868.1 Catechol 2,3-dioxygenase [Roseibium suaedae]
MATGLSHITFIVSDLERMSLVLTSVLGAREVYSSGEDMFSISQEKFFLVGDVWVAIMKGAPLTERTYNHVAFQISEEDYDDCVRKISELGLDMRPPRPRVEGEGRSIYFHDHDNHLFELHTGTLDERLKRYAQLAAAGK